VTEKNSLLRLATAAQQNPIQPKILDERQEEFLDWLLLPEEMRVPRTMVDYGEVHDLSYATLKRWKQAPHFRATYEKRVKEQIATPERVEEATRLAYQRGILDGDIKWATLWAQMAGLTKQEPGIAKSGAEAIADLSDEELDALLADSARQEKKKRLSG
jgi:hypothetical protein